MGGLGGVKDRLRIEFSETCGRGSMPGYLAPTSESRHKPERDRGVKQFRVGPTHIERSVAD